MSKYGEVREFTLCADFVCPHCKTGQHKSFSIDDIEIRAEECELCGMEIECKIETECIECRKRIVLVVRDM